MTRADEALVDGLALGVQWQSAEEIGRLGDFDELIVGSDLGRGKPNVRSTGTRFELWDMGVPQS